MFFDFEIIDDLLTIPPTAPHITRQYGCSNLLALTSLNNYERSNPVLSVDTEVNNYEHILRSMPNLSNLSTKDLPPVKRYNSDSKQFTKSQSNSLKRINTF
uniref:Uncharacterized protein n=1 Tax=viral metagenome TaxID=1070528 RepID=A0A6C0LFT0_9ZZZZ